MNSEIINHIQQQFSTQFKTTPILVFSPGRINIIGEHTDYNEGFVFPAAVNKGIYAAFQHTNATESTVVALDLKDSISFNLNNISPLKTQVWGNYIIGVIAELQKRNKSIGNFNMVFSGDIPAGAGMSSSAALENAVVFGLNTLFNLNLSKNDMIFIAQHAEHNYVGVKCGIMDQYASMFGIENHALHLDCRSILAKPYKIDFKDYELMLINTNVKHSLSDSAYNDRRSVCEKVSNLLQVKALRDATETDLNSIKHKISEADYQKALFVIQEIKRTELAAKAIEDNAIMTLGKLIYQSHEGLKNKYHVSCDELDFLVDEAQKNNAVIGARMMGGGFGGCTINIIKKVAVNDFKNTISASYKQKFNTDCSVYSVHLSNGTHLITQ